MGKNDDRPAWDEGGAEALVGQTVLIGITYVDGADKAVRQEQLHGLIVSADPAKGFEIELEGKRAGEIYWLPPHISAFNPARPGEYRLRTTGEVVTNPDLLSTWTINAPRN